MHDLPLYLFSKTPFPDTIHIPVLTIRHLSPEIDFDRYDRLLVTSKEAVEALEAIDDRWKQLPVLCVAAKSAEKVREHGGKVMETGNGYGDDLEKIIKTEKRELRWLYAKPVIAASDFSGRLRSEGYDIDDVAVYETACNPNADMTVKDHAVLAFTSPSAVECFVKQYGFKPTHKVIVIGKTTMAALPEGIKARMPEITSVEALVALGKEIAGGNTAF
ncbi:MAG: uroporphyrinogen-III synthase [Sulfurimonadaceae bacterium]|nr:uroporphyrinogen-III synthase [Sulfurimonadaceae bacterium]